MGQEVTCAVRGRAGLERATVLLETHELRVRRPLPMVIPFSTITALRVEGDWLVVGDATGETAFQVGASVAARWAERIRSPRSRLQKLGMQAGQRVAVVGRADDTLVSELEAAGVRVSHRMPPAGAGVDAVVLGADRRAALRRVPAAAAALAPAGALWVVRPKGTPAISEAETRAAGLAAGLVDVKVVSVSALHTAEKFVIPLARRGGVKRAAVQGGKTGA